MTVAGEESTGDGSFRLPGELVLRAPMPVLTLPLPVPLTSGTAAPAGTERVVLGTPGRAGTPSAALRPGRSSAVFLKLLPRRRCLRCTVGSVLVVVPVVVSSAGLSFSLLLPRLPVGEPVLPVPPPPTLPLAAPAPLYPPPNPKLAFSPLELSSSSSAPMVKPRRRRRGGVDFLPRAAVGGCGGEGGAPGGPLGDPLVYA